MNHKIKSRTMIILILIPCFTGASCAGKPVPPSTTTVSQDQLGDEAYVRPGAESPQAMDPEAKAIPNPTPMLYSPFYPMSGGAFEAALALTMAGTVAGLSRVVKTSTDRSDLSGTCVYGKPDAPVTTACINVEVHLLDSEKKIVSRSVTNRRGDFQFLIPSGKSYFVQVIDRKGREATTKVKVGRSEYVLLNLVP